MYLFQIQNWVIKISGSLPDNSGHQRKYLLTAISIAITIRFIALKYILNCNIGSKQQEQKEKRTENVMCVVFRVFLFLLLR